MSNGYCFVVLGSEDYELPTTHFQDDVDYMVLMLGKPRPIETLYDLAKKVVAAGNRLLININNNEHELVVKTDEDISVMCNVLSMLSEA